MVKLFDADFSCFLFAQPTDNEVIHLVQEAGRLASERHHDAPTIQNQVSSMETRWKRFLSRIEEHRTMLEASIEFHQLYEQVLHSVYFIHVICIFLSMLSFSSSFFCFHHLPFVLNRRLPGQAIVNTSCRQHASKPSNVTQKNKSSISWIF